MLEKYKSDSIALTLLLFTIPLFFYNLGQSSLSSWDEAWYAQISRNILKGDWFYLWFNNDPYTDHPPLGFWLESIAFLIFGVNEFAARFFQALAGFGTIVALYFLGKQLFNRWVGLLASIALVSAPWFLYRARSGNLDSLLVSLFVLTLFLGLKAAKNPKWIIPFSLSLSGLFLTKTLIPVTILPALVIIFWKSKIPKLYLVFPVLFLLLTFGSWFFLQHLHKDDFIDRFFFIGFPPPEKQSTLMENLWTTKLMIHNGLGKWFWPGIAALFLSLLLFQKRFLILTIFFISFVTPFLFSSRGGIWHLIPIYPIMILSFIGFFYVVLEKLLSVIARPQSGEAISKNRFWTSQNDTIRNIMIILPIATIVSFYSYKQLKANWYQFIDIPPQISSTVVLLKEAGNYSEPFYIDGEDIVPEAVFYSQKDTSKVWEGRVREMFESDEQFILLTKQERLNRLEVPKEKYQIIKESQDNILVVSSK